MRLIDADALIKAIDGNPFTTDSVKSYIHVSVAKMPTIEPERKKGEWILGEDMPDYSRVPYKYGRLYCSNCRNLAYFDRNLELPFFDYCPNCGADMRGAP